MLELLGSDDAPILRRVQTDLLRARTADLALGHFFLPEFAAIAEEAGRVRKLRLLIGTNAERFDPADLLDEQARVTAARSALEAERYPGRGEIGRRVTRLGESVRRMLARMTQSDMDARTVARLLDLVESGALEVRAYVRERLGTDVLLCNFDGTGAGGAAIHGSGNLLAPASLAGGTQVWQRTDDAAARQALQARFDAWWSGAQPFKEPLLAALRESWAGAPTTPYLLYLQVLSRLVADRLLDAVDAEETLTESAVEGFPPLTDFQQVAVQQALSIVGQHGGVFVADVVGLGKTYIGTALLKRLAQQGQRATIFCPPALVPMWEDFNSVYGLSAEVVSTGRLLVREGGGVNLAEPKYQTADRQVVLVDESHRFRNRGTDAYRILSDYSRGRRCILLTATPYNLRAQDIYQQIRLFADDDLDLGLNPPRLSDVFRRIENGQASLVDVLRPLLIRRTRKHIQKHYPDATILVRQPNGTEVRQKLVFPRREAPRPVRYDVEGV